MSRILFCVPHYPPTPGGAPALFRDLARLWRQSGGESVVYTTGIPGRETSAGDGERDWRVRRFPLRPARWPAARAHLLGPVSRIGPARWRAATGFPYLRTADYRRFLARRAAAVDGPFDLIVCGVLPHCHFMEPAARLARRARTPYLAVPLLHAGLLAHHPPDHILGPAAVPLLHGAARIALMTEAETAPLVARGLPRSRLVVTAAGVDETAPPGDGEAFASRHHLDRRWVLQAGGLSGDKGTLDLLAAWTLRHDRGARDPLVLIGRPEPEVRQAVTSLPPGVRDLVHLLEDPSGPDWSGALHGAAALVHPSRAESFGLILLEAWRESVPVIVARAGGPSFLIRHETDGLLVPPGDPRHLAAAMDRLLGDAALARQLARAGRQRLLDRFTWPQIFPRWRALFAEAMAA
ncbi:MAG: glycosyltransferase family 4 protein [Acidobacteriota bacterium]